MAVWDTSLASRVRPDNEVYRLIESQAAGTDRVRLAATVVQEVIHGYQARAADSASFAAALDWFQEFVATELIEVLPLDREAAIVAGKVRALHPFVPDHAAAKRRRPRRSKAEGRVAWVLDIQIAATAWTAGLPVCTDDRAHFEALSEFIAALYPDTTPLEVQAPPV